MGKLGWSLLILYVMAASGYGGWRGRDLWQGWGVWCLLVPSIALAAYKVIGERRRNPYWGIIKIYLVLAVVGVVALGGAILGIAWVVAEATEQWSALPAVRAVTGAALGAAAGSLALFSALSRKATKPRPGTDSETTDGRGPGSS